MDCFEASGDLDYVAPEEFFGDGGVDVGRVVVGEEEAVGGFGVVGVVV